MFLDAHFFPYSSFTCEADQPVTVCTWYSTEIIGMAPSTWRRETADGRIVLALGGSPGSVAGFDACTCCNIDVCPCLDVE